MKRVSESIIYYLHPSFPCTPSLPSTHRTAAQGLSATLNTTWYIQHLVYSPPARFGRHDGHAARPAGKPRAREENGLALSATFSGARPSAGASRPLQARRRSIPRQKNRVAIAERDRTTNNRARADVDISHLSRSAPSFVRRAGTRFDPKRPKRPKRESSEQHHLYHHYYDDSRDRWRQKFPKKISPTVLDGNTYSRRAPPFPSHTFMSSCTNAGASAKRPSSDIEEPPSSLGASKSSMHLSSQSVKKKSRREARTKIDRTQARAWTYVRTEGRFARVGVICPPVPLPLP